MTMTMPPTTTNGAASHNEPVAMATVEAM